MYTPDFGDLDKYINDWALRTDEERLNKRMTSTLAELQEFHAAVNPRLEEIVEFLNQFQVDQLPEEYQYLANFAFMAIEVDDPVTMWKVPKLDLAQDPRTWVNKKNFYDNRRV